MSPLPPPPHRGSPFARVEALLQGAIAARAFPAAVIEVGTGSDVIWQGAFGRLTYDQTSPPATADTIFDLASLTKVVSTAALAMRLVDSRRLGLTDRIDRWLPEWRGTDRDQVAVSQLLAHASGLTAHLPLFRDYRGRQEFQPAICALPLEYPPGSQAVYSDLGFILLGFILADAGGAALDEQFAGVADALALGEIRFRPPSAWRSRTAPTELDPWRGRTLVGEVHDENAWALGGVAGHTGLFGTAGAIGRFARLVLRTLTGPTPLARTETLRTFVTPTGVPGSSRALGWDTMRPTSSCGHRMSAAAVGHTGFTGTSLWIDPPADVYVVLLTNRVHPTRTNEAILPLRPQVHDAILEELHREATEGTEKRGQRDNGGNGGS